MEHIFIIQVQIWDKFWPMISSRNISYSLTESILLSWTAMNADNISITAIIDWESG